MRQEVEITSFDLRYESCRIKHAGAERALCASILEQGIREPLQGVDSKDVRILLNGFKRFRCARKLGIQKVPYASLGEDEAFGIVQLIRIANSRTLGMVEQARLMDELRTLHNMSLGEIARLVERSRAWVSMRVGLIDEMSEGVLSRVFSGEFPFYAYLYTLRRFMRINAATKQEVDAFVRAVAGKHLSLREIERLADGYFRGPRGLREQIEQGDVTWGLKRLKEPVEQAGPCTKAERALLGNLELVRRCMERVVYAIEAGRYSSRAFWVQADLLAGGVLDRVEGFSKAVGRLHDRSGQA